MPLHDFLRALGRETTPCAKFSCEKFSECATGKACEAWVWFVRTGKAGNPTATKFSLDAGLPAGGSEIVATRALFAQAELMNSFGEEK